MSSDEIIAVILAAVAKQGAGYAIADYAIFNKEHQFLKKSPVWLGREGSDITFRLIDKLPEPARSEIREEALELRARRAKFEVADESDQPD